MQPVSGDHDSGSDVSSGGGDADCSLRGVAEQSGDPFRLAKGGAAFPAHGVDEHRVEAGASNTEPRSRATAGRYREGQPDPRTGAGVLEGDPAQRARSSRDDGLVQAQPAERRHAGRHHPFAACLIARESGTIHQDHVVSVAGEQQRGGCTARTRAHNDGVGLDHVGTVAEPTVCGRTLRVGPGVDDGSVNFLSGLHGAVALALLPALLFAEEAGVPLPFAPGELVLLIAGLLIASGGLNPYAFIPLAYVACTAGSMIGYSWARAVGDHGLRGLARRLRQQRNLDRVEERLRATGWRGIAISRLIPGLRIYTTLVAGAVRVGRQTFIVAMVTSTVAWIGVFVALGILIGVPVEHFLDRIQKLAVQGALLVAMGVGCYLAVRKTPSSSGAGLVRVPRWVRVVLAALIDIGVVASIVTGLLALGRLFGLGFGSGWVDPVVALLVVGAFYVIVARRSAGATAGEVLLQTSYVSGHGLPLKPRAALAAVRSLVSRSDDELTATGDLLHALGDPTRLCIVTQLLDRPQTLDELAARTKLSAFGVRHQLDRFPATGVLVVSGQESNPTYAVRADLRHVLLQLLAIMESTLTTS